MVTKFNKRQLLDQCGFTADETQIILDYQKKLPILVENDGTDGFCVNARDLWNQLECPQGKFMNWVTRKFIPYGFAENVDFKASQICEPLNMGISGMDKPKEYILTIDMAKQLAMIDKKEIGFITRHYFILMEKAVKRNTEWELIRYPLREGYKTMQKALDNFMIRNVQRNADDWDYRYEADALNIICCGYPAKEIRLFVGCRDNVTRDSLTSTYNEYLLKLQELNIIYLGMNMNRYDRYKMLKQSFEILFPNAIPIKDDVDIHRIKDNKEKFLEEIKKKVQAVA